MFPKKLIKGDLIEIVATAKAVTLEEIKPAIDYLNIHGFNVKVNPLLFEKEFTFAGTDKNRIEVFNEAINDPDVKAIICARGGYGTGRIIESLDFTNKKWIVGYSDLTILHHHAYANNLLSTIHGPMAFGFGTAKIECLDRLLDILKGEYKDLVFDGETSHESYITQGKLLGGNLSLLTHILGTSSETNWNDVILFIEDIDEYLYNLERMWYQIARNEKLNKLKAIIVGGFTELKDNENPFGKDYRKIILSCTPKNIPVFFNAPIGHFDHNEPVIQGANINLIHENGKTRIQYLK